MTFIRPIILNYLRSLDHLRSPKGKTDLPRKRIYLTTSINVLNTVHNVYVALIVTTYLFLLRLRITLLRTQRLTCIHSARRTLQRTNYIIQLTRNNPHRADSYTKQPVERLVKIIRESAQYIL